MHYALKRARLILVGILGNPGFNLDGDASLDFSDATNSMYIGLF